MDLKAGEVSMISNRETIDNMVSCDRAVTVPLAGTDVTIPGTLTWNWSAGLNVTRAFASNAFRPVSRFE